MRPIEVARYYRRSETLVSLLEVPSAALPPASPSRPNKAQPALKVTPITAPIEAAQTAQAAQAAQMAASLAREAAAQAAAVAAAEEEEVEQESEESVRRRAKSRLRSLSSISKELRTQRAVPLWIGPNGLMKEIIARSVDDDVDEDADAEDEGGAEEEGEGGASGHAQPSSARAPPRPVKTGVKRLPSASLNAADAHVSSRRQGGDRGESSGTVPNSTVSLEAQLLMRSQAREERRGISTTRMGAQHGASHHGGGGGGGIENASAALMEQLAISARESASRRARDGIEHEGGARRAERLSGEADRNCSEAQLSGPSLVAVLVEEVQHAILVSAR